MKRQLPLALALVLLALACVPAWASDGELALLAQDLKKSPNECDYWVMKHRGNTQGQGFGSCVPPVIQVYASLGGASAGGITGAEFACNIGPDAGADPGYFLIEFPNFTATNILGRAFVPPDPSPRGMNISWSDCQTGDGSRVLLETVIVFNTAACGPSAKPPALTFGGAQHASPSNVFFRCPLFTLCDGPVFTKVCLGTNIVDCQTPVPPFPNASKCSTSGGFKLNAPNNEAGTCSNLKGGLAVNTIQSDTWSNVKNLYR